MMGTSSYEFSFYPIDCKYKKIEYKISEEYRVDTTPPNKITFKFITSDTNQLLQGTLYFDEEIYKTTSGTEQIFW